MSPRILVAGAAALILAVSHNAFAQSEKPAAASAPVVAAAAAPAPAPAATPVADAAEGKLAYYGKKFAGRKTASGERFNPAALTMAHKTLPMGTLVRITNVKTKRSVVVRVNDRGPSQADRIGDVSLAAARKLGMLHAGVVTAKLQVVGKAKSHRHHKSAHKTAHKHH
jgi:rare lipoprotein A